MPVCVNGLLLPGLALLLWANLETDWAVLNHELALALKYCVA